MRLECLALLDDIANRQIAGTKIGEYKSFIANYQNGNRSKLVDNLLQHVEPEILALTGKLVNSEHLDEIRHLQSGHWPLNVGYLDYVLDDRSDLYIRYYVGQTKFSGRRILVEHMQSILRASFQSLHYYILWLGNGHRSANFLRLWSFPEAQADQIIDAQTVADLLETLFIRAFKSDHGACTPKSSEAYFCDQRIGLNVATPLTDYNMFAFPPTSSPDPQIRQWEHFRQTYRKRKGNQQTGTHTDRFDCTYADYVKALSASIGDKVCMEELQSHLCPSSHSTTSSSAPVAFILDYAAVVDCDLQVAQTCVKDADGIPWALSQTGFCGTNAIQWTVDFGQFGLPTPSQSQRLSR